MSEIYLKDTDIIVLPTDTVYGIGCKMQAQSTLKRLFEIKKRPFEKAIPVLVSSICQATEFALFSKKELKLANAFWPGALTLVLKTKPEFVELLGETVAVRMPKHKITLKIIEKNGPLRVTSCNISGERPLNNPLEIEMTFSDKVQYYIFDSVASHFSNLPSTIVKITEDQVNLLRQGAISEEKILNVLNTSNG